MQDAPNSAQGEADRLKFERDLVLQEYKTHHEEVFKYTSYMNQAVGAYLVLFSILVAFAGNYRLPENQETALVSLPTLQRWIPIVIIYASFALLYVIYQLRFMTAAHNQYVMGPLRERMRACGASAPGDWEVSVPLLRKPSLAWYFRWPVKHGINLIPYLVVLMAIVRYCCTFVCGDVRDVWDGTELWKLWYLALEIFLPLSLLLWSRACFKFLSKKERKSAELAESS